ncbi:MAG: DUF2839 domain-containing protein [Cyanobium sp.]
MGEAKRRAAQGLPPREKKTVEKAAGLKKAAAKSPASGAASPRLVAWLPLTREQADRFVSWTSRGAWVGIAALVLLWVTVRFLGPALGWWTLADG